MRMPRLNRMAINGLALLSIPVAILLTASAIANKPSSVATKPEMVLPKVTTLNVEAGPHYSELELYGEVKALETLNLLGEVSGRVITKSEKFQPGQEVREGELLLEIDDASYRVELADARKQLADAHLALLQEKRKKQRAEAEWKVSGIAGKPSQLGLREPQLAVAQTQYEAAQERVALALEKLNKTKIYAPFDAVVISRNVASGSYISQGSQIGELKSIAQLEIKLALSQRQWQQLPSVLDDMQVQVLSRGKDNLVWLGRAKDLSLVVDSKTRTRTLTVVVDSPLESEQPLLLGSFVKVRILGKKLDASFELPPSSVTADGFIWFELGGQLHKQKVRPLFQNRKAITIAKGELSNQLNLVRKPLSHYVEGMAVMASSESAYVN